MERLNELLPDFRLTLGAGRENLLNGYLKNNGIRFERGTGRRNRRVA
ncbi:MAG: hypothetical protein ACLTZT_12840 [Butyricimonas faecalis]